MMRVLGVICLFFLFFSCKDEPTYLEFQDIENQVWTNTDTLEFTLTGDLENKQPTLLIRHSNDYLFQNIWLKIATDSSQFYREEFLLADVMGRWYGKKSGALYTLEYPLETITVSDSTTIYLIQNMRMSDLTCLQAVGLKVE